VTRPPAAVTVSSWLLIAAALLSAADLVLSYHGQQARDEAYWAAVKADEIENASAFAAVIGLEVLLIVLLWITGTVFLVVIAVQNLRGRPAGRNATWMLSGLMLCCPGVNTVGLAASLSGGASTDPVDQRMDQLLPGWYGNVAAAVDLGLLACLLTAAALLTLRPVSRYFQSVRPPTTP
jgi:hypothetical protein